MTTICNSLARACALLLLASPYAALQTPSASPTVETDPVPSSGDAADDMTFWVHPTDRSLSLVIGTDKNSGILVYDLDGKELQYLPDGELNNVDIRPGFELGGEEVALVTSGERGQRRLAIYAVDPDTRSLYAVEARDIDLNIPVYGCCMYRSPFTDDVYFFCTSEDGDVQQWRLFATASGTKVDAELVRSFSVGSQCEGIVADDDYSYLYVGEEAEGIWRYGAEPGAGTARVSIDTTSGSGHLEADVEGLAIYYAGEEGYLIASSQGNSTFVVYERQPPNEHRLTFAIGANSALGIDAVSDTDGIDVTSAALGSAFPGGVFAAQDGSNTGGKQNYKLVPWPAIAALASPPLLGATTASAPVAAFAASPSGTALEFAFTDQSSGNVTAWTWDFGDGAGSDQQDPVHAYAAVGSYTVRLTVSGPDGSDSAEKVVDLQADAPGADFRYSISDTDPQELAFTDESTGDVTAWAWDFGDGTGAGAQHPVHVYAADGDYTVRLTVTGPGGSDSVEALVTVDSDTTGGGGGASGGGGSSGGGGCFAALGPDGRMGGGDLSLALSLALALAVIVLRGARPQRDPRLAAGPPG